MCAKKPLINKSMKNKTIAYIGLGAWLLAFFGSIFGGNLYYPISLVAGLGTIFFLIMAIKRLWGNNRIIPLALIISVVLFLVMALLKINTIIPPILFMLSLFWAIAKLFKLKDKEIIENK